MAHDETVSEHSEVDRLRARLHKLADMLQVHEVRLGEHTIMLTVMREAMESLRQTSVTRAAFEAAINGMATKLDLFHTEHSLKLDHIREEIAPIRSGIRWAVGLVLTAVIVALLGLIIKP